MRVWWIVALVACGGSKDEDPPPDDTGTPATTTPAGTPAGTTTTEPTPPRDWCPPLVATPDRTVMPGDDLVAAVAAAVPGEVIALAAGTHTLDTEGLELSAEGVTLIGATGDAADVIVDGTFGPSRVLDITASDVTVAHITFTRSFFEGIRVQPSDIADQSGVELYGVVVEDAGAEAIRIEPHSSAGWSDGGRVACSTLRLTELGRDRQRAGCDVAGVVIEGAQGWTVEDTVVEGMWCPSGLAGAGIHVADGARDTTIQRNRVRDSAIGIQVGRGTEPPTRTWDDATCDGVVQHLGATVRNNMVSTVDGDLFASAEGFAAGVALQSACDSTVLHNTVYSAQAPAWAAIEFSHPDTTGVVANSLTTHGMARRDDAPITNDSNLENAERFVFLDPDRHAVHLNPGTPDAVGDGNPAYLADCPDDIDGQLRDDAPDVGADELRAL